MTEQGVFGQVDLDDELAHVTALVGVQVPWGERGGEREEGRENVKETGPTRRVSRTDPQKTLLQPLVARSRPASTSSL
jgi:hypothetical protein